jgi:membrane protein implicated in regulation of membrane protease activity
MSSKYSPYLPWGDRWMSSAFVVCLVGLGAVAIVFLGEAFAISWLSLGAGVVGALAVLVGSVILVIRFPYNVYLAWRSFRDAWNHPPDSRNHDWRP